MKDEIERLRPCVIDLSPDELEVVMELILAELVKVTSRVRYELKLDRIIYMDDDLSVRYGLLRNMYQRMQDNEERRKDELRQSRS